MSAPDERAQRLQVAVDANEKLRGRARAVASLCAAAAGALAAGLVFSSSVSIPAEARYFGLFAVTLLIAAAALGVGASSTSAYKKIDKFPVDLVHLVEIWRVRTEPLSDPNAGTHAELLEDAKAIKRGISLVFSWGLWCAALAAISLIASLSIAAFAASDTRVVTIEVGSTPSILSCPDLGRIFRGEVRTVDLETQSGLLRVEVPAVECGNDTGVTLSLEIATTTIVGN